MEPNPLGSGGEINPQSLLFVSPDQSLRFLPSGAYQERSPLGALS